MVLGSDAEVLGGLMANATGWLGVSDETHCGKMATLKVLPYNTACFHVFGGGCTTCGDRARAAYAVCTQLERHPCHAARSVHFLQMLLRTWSADVTAHNKVLLFSHSVRCLDLLQVRACVYV